MGEYERSITISAPMQKVEAFVTDVENLPKYLPTTKKAEPQDGERVRVQGEARGQSYDSDGYFRMNKSQNRMEWGSDGEENYKGWLQFSPMAAQNQTQVIVHLTFDPPPKMGEKLAQSTASKEQTIEKGLEEAMLSIKNIVEGRGGKIDNLQA